MGVTYTKRNQTVYGNLKDLHYFYVPTHAFNVHNGDKDKDDGYNGEIVFSNIQNHNKSCIRKIYIKSFQATYIKKNS